MGKGTFLEAAYQILKKSSKPLTSNEISSIAMDEHLITTEGKTPSNTMRALLYLDIKRKGNNSRFVKAERGKFELK